MTLPIAMLGMDITGQARTGTGKTLAFGVPLLQRIVPPGDPAYSDLVAPGKPQALVVVPTRELALQVSGDLKLAAGRSGVRLVTIYGGRAYDPQIDTLRRGVEIVVGTPGRLLDLADQGHLDLSHVKILILDEADEMLDLGFLPDVEKLIGLTPDNRQTMLFRRRCPLGSRCPGIHAAAHQYPCRGPSRDRHRSRPFSTSSAHTPETSWSSWHVFCKL
jgi:superfamily II DNA/RNA helicase